MKKLLAVFCAIGLVFSLAAQNMNDDPLNAVVCVDSIFYRPNYFIPWESKMQDAGSGSGVVISGNRILTVAHNVADATYITVRRQNEDAKHPARVLFVDHDCDLALLTVDEPAFFANVTPFELGQTPLPQTPVVVAGFPIGGDELSITQGVISRVECRSYVHSLHYLLAAQLDAAINPGNSGGPVISDGLLVGIAFQGNSSGEGLGYMIPTEIIRHFLKDIEDGRVDGFGYVGFTFSTLENPATRRFLKMKENQTGVRIISVKEATKDVLRPDDVLLAVEGLTVANNGNVRPLGGIARQFASLLTQKQLGEKVHLVILRDGEELEVELTIRKIPGQCLGRLYDKLPDYYIIGGFIFTTLSDSFLDEWQNNAPPSELVALRSKEREAPGHEAVVLSMVLGDKVNMGYQFLGTEHLTKVNGKKVLNLKDLVSLVENCEEEFITFTMGENFPVTLDLKEIKAATPSILERYRVPYDRRLENLAR